MDQLKKKKALNAKKKKKIDVSLQLYQYYFS